MKLFVTAVFLISTTICINSLSVADGNPVVIQNISDQSIQQYTESPNPMIIIAQRREQFQTVPLGGSGGGAHHIDLGTDTLAALIKGIPGACRAAAADFKRWWNSKPGDQCRKHIKKVIDHPAYQPRPQDPNRIPK